MRQPYWEWGMWQYRAVVTQANAAGGAIIVDVVPVAGMDMLVIHAAGTNSGTNGIAIYRMDEDDAVAGVYVSVASGAGTIASIPRSLQGGGTSEQFDSVDIMTRLIRSDDKLAFQQSVAGAQNDTLAINIRALLSSAERPIVTKARSTNSADVTIATPTVDKIR